MTNHQITLPLLNAVIESGIESFDIRDNTIYYTSRSFLSNKEMNLDTFCFRCKEWALEKKQEVTYIKNDGVFINASWSTYDAYNLSDNLEYDYHLDNIVGLPEQQAIIKATLWVLENK